MVYTPNEVLDRKNALKAGMVVVITKVTPGRSKVGSYFDVECTDGKTYRTYSEYLMQDLKKLVKDEFDFTEGFAVEIAGHIAEETGNTYLTFESPSKDALEEVMAEHPIGKKPASGKGKPKPKPSSDEDDE